MRRLALASGIGALACAALLVTTALWSPATSNAADHNDPPMRTGSDQAADIGDLFVWHTGTGADARIVVALTVSGASMPVADQAGNYDTDVLYGIHFSNTGSGGTPAYASTHDIWVRFGQDGAGAWGMQVTDLPGETGPVEGAVEEAMTAPNGGMAWAGLADDPFFFDLEGFQDLSSTGELSSFDSVSSGFTSTRDSVMGANATVIVLEFPASEVTNAGGMVHAWATTGRI